MTAVWILLAAALLAAALLIGAYVCWRIAFYSPKKGQNDDYRLPGGPQYEKYHARMRQMVARLAAEPCERVEITARDGTRLSARLYRRGEGGPLDICMHGYRGTAVRDFCGGGWFSLSEGRSVLLVDERAHGNSGGHAICFGVKERFDCLDWAAWACARFGAETPVMFYGVSMGAATVLMAAGLPLPENVRGVIADCPYSSPKAIVKKVMRDMRLPGALYPVVALGARLFAGFSLSAASAEEAVRQARVPVLILHGEDDRFVPAAMSAAIRAANPEIVERHTFPNAAHGMSYMEDEARYVRIVRDFLRRCGGAGEEGAHPCGADRKSV